MSGNKRLYLFSSLFIFIILLSAFFIINSHAAGLVIYGSNQMSAGSSQTLSVSAGCGGPYQWTLSGGGSLSATTGSSVTYYAPSTNPNCSSNPTICVTDSRGQKTCMRIAVNASSGSNVYKVKRCHSEYSSCYLTGKYPSSPNAVEEYCAVVWFYNGTCDGTETYAGQCGGGYGSSLQGNCGYCAGINRNSCEAAALADNLPSDCSYGTNKNPLNVPLDNRTSSQKTAGCCPAGTLPPDPAPVTVASCSPCNLHITGFTASPSTFNAGSGDTTFSGSITATNPVNWTLTVADRTFNGSDTSVSQTWDGKNAAGQFVQSGAYPATLWASDSYNPSCNSSTSTSVNIANCDLQAELDVVNAVVDQNGSVNFTGNVSSSKPFSWEVTIGSTVIASGTSADVKARWNLKDEKFKLGQSKKYTATLTVISSDGTCTATATKNFTIKYREKDCKLKIKATSSIDAPSGNLSHSQNLFTVPNSGLMSDFTLYYNSTDGYSGMLGDSWTHTYNIFVSTDPTDDAYILSDGRGGMISLYRNGDYYTSDISLYPFLQVNADSTFTLTYKNGTIYSFNTSGRLTAIADKNGNTVHLAYSSGGNLASITDATGKTIYLSYNAHNRISSINDPNNNSYTFTYSGDMLTQVSSHNSLGTQTWRYTYDANAFMLTKTDPQGNLVQYAYDEEYRVSQNIDPQGGTINVQYDPENNTTTVTEKDGGVWIYRYDPVLGALKSKTDPAGGTTLYEYDANRNLTSKIEPDGSATEYTYDDYGNMTSVTDALGNTTAYAYNDDNLVTSITDAAGKQTKYTYDTRGNILSTTDPAGAITLYAYDSRGNIISITAPNGSVTQMAYDANNNLISITDPGGQTTTQTYDNAGNMISQTDAAGNKTTFQYNSLNQLIALTDSAGKTTRYTYDANGNRLSVTDANGNTTTYDYNYRNQLIQTTDAAGFRTSFSYGTGGCSTCADGGDRLIALTDARDNTTTYQYDQTGRLMKETDPLGNATTYTYDAKGNMISKIKPDGRTISYYYDELNRLVKRKYADNTSDIFQYDASGNMTVATNSNIAYYYSYDVNNRMTGVTSYNLAQIFTIGYQYDIMGNRTMMTMKEGASAPHAINYEYNPNSQMTKITSDTMGSFTFAYDSLGRRIKRTLPNDSYTTYAYDQLSRLNGMTHINAFNQTIDSFAYTHDNVGNRTAKKDNHKSISYSYDPIYRLTKATPKSNIKLIGLMQDITNHHSEAYSYDPVGNRQAGPDKFDSYAYNDGNELLTAKEQHVKNKDYEYDLNGNLVKKTEIIGKWKVITSYTYDDENRLTTVTIQKGDKIREVSFTYDPFGRRISKTIQREDLDDDNNIIDKLLNKLNCPRTTYYIYDEQNIIAEYDQNNKQTATYIHGPNIDEPLAADIRNTRIYYHADGLGSITTLTNHMGHKVQQYDYDSFGNIKSTPFWIKQPFTYTGREYDSETGLYYYRARYYDPKAGRFVTRDPIGFGGGINQYVYVGNNPVNWIDPSGLYVEVGVRPFYPYKVPYARHCFVRFNGKNSDTLSFDKKGVHPDPNPGGATYSKTTDGNSATDNDCADDCVRKTMKQCKGSDYDFTGFNCCMCVSNALYACGLKKRGPWPNSPAEARKPPYTPPSPGFPFLGTP